MQCGYSFGLNTVCRLAWLAAGWHSGCGCAHLSGNHGPSGQRTHSMAGLAAQYICCRSWQLNPGYVASVISYGPSMSCNGWPQSGLALRQTYKSLTLEVPAETEANCAVCRLVYFYYYSIMCVCVCLLCILCVSDGIQYVCQYHWLYVISILFWLVCIFGSVVSWHGMVSSWRSLAAHAALAAQHRGGAGSKHQAQRSWRLSAHKPAAHAYQHRRWRSVALSASQPSLMPGGSLRRKLLQPSVMSNG